MMKLFVIDFEPVYPVGSGLVILAKDSKEAAEIARKTISHTDKFTLGEVPMDKSMVIFFDDGDY